MSSDIAVIIGAGPAGLTAAIELQKRTQSKVIVLESTKDIGGISKTVNFKGNRIDIGGHRFFSKSDRVMDWWRELFPLQSGPARDDKLLGRILKWDKNGLDPEKHDGVMLLRGRLSRIFFLRKFFEYPISLNLNTILNLGLIRLIKAGISYVLAKIFPKKDETHLENFFINRFGKELYATFFEDYTEKVWGIHPSKIKADWGAQRVKGLSITTVLLHAVKSLLKLNKDSGIAQKNTETSLIEEFLYPKLGPGQLWEKAADLVKKAGGEVRMEHQVVALNIINGQIQFVEILEVSTGKTYKIENPKYVFSSMPIKELVAGFTGDEVPQEVKEVASGLVYRDFITVGLLLNKLKIKNETKQPTVNGIVPDNWIYIQERDVKVGRLQIFNNWSPYMVKDANHIWIGMEYFCTEGDELWIKETKEMQSFAIDELSQIDIIDKKDVIDSVVVKVPKAYPAYFGTYDHFNIVQRYTDKIDNLFLIGRNGQHRYNNSDHSMLCAMVAVDNIVAGIRDRANIWSVNTEQEYHEGKKES